MIVGAERKSRFIGGDYPSSIEPRVFHVDRKEISYLRFTLESYDGMAIVTTLDPYTALIEVSIAPGCEETIFDQP